MDSACAYEENTVIHELTQGLLMAQQLRVNLQSPEARDLFIQMILSSYHNALFVLQSGHSGQQPPAPALSAPSLLESSVSFGSPGIEEFEFDQPFSGQQRKGSPTWEDQVRISRSKGLESDIVPTSTSFGLMEDNHQLHFPNHYDDELLQVYATPLIAPVTSESGFFTEWGSSPSQDLPAGLADVHLDFESMSSFF